MGQKKFRVLCLHGYSQNGDAFRIKSRGLRSSIDSLAELAFIDAPHSTLWAESADFNEREHENQIKARRYQGWLATFLID
ncbi:hypothetical protein EV182_004836 [Spiromyces aspiralis]|uniref:Uncharacterized protein n=1 Tax=Spiromyces aspiralis TaxID=68401 RepID=A0ACC1HIB0_9FUNG|nr:hypothetical protein EV182_004836 [Spiromyces aspiralis]